MGKIRFAPLKWSLVILLGIVIASSLSSVKALAASPSQLSLRGITVAPAIVNLDLQKGQASNTFTIMLTDNTKNNVTLTPSSVDFKSLNQSGGLAFIGDNAGQLAHKYGLASWIDLPNGPVQLAPNQTKPIQIRVENRSDLSPGGHYAAVLFKFAENSQGTNQVDINQVVSTLVFVRKVDGEHYGIALAHPTVPTSLTHLPTNLDLFFTNTGNVQEVPRGLVTITSPSGHEVARGQINTDASLVLPESTRLSRTALSPVSHAWWPGRYQLHVEYFYDGGLSTTTISTSFVYFNIWSVVISLLALILICYGLVTLRRYGKRRTKRHQKPPPPPRRQIPIS